MPDEAYGCFNRNDAQIGIALAALTAFAMVCLVVIGFIAASFPSGPAGGESHPSVIVVESPE